MPFQNKSGYSVNWTSLDQWLIELGFSHLEHRKAIKQHFAGMAFIEILEDWARTRLKAKNMLNAVAKASQD